MPRSGARTSSSGPKRAAPAAQAPPPAQHRAPPPAAAPAAAPPATAPAGGGMLSGLMGSMASGMAMGTGMAVANRAVDAVMGPRQTEVVHRTEGAPPQAQAQNTCQFQQDQLAQCLKSSSDATSCQHFMDALKACQQTA
ncbi:SLC4A4 [Symbiodinium sp. CCMP2592]|nr:SLC4A4 [Symbiodinium sp. CCMP2592]